MKKKFERDVMNFFYLLFTVALTFSLNAQPKYQYACAIECKHALGDITFVKKLNENLMMAVDEHGWAEILNYKEFNQTYRQYFILPKNLFFPLHKTVLFDDINAMYYLIIVMTHNGGSFKQYIINGIHNFPDENRKLDLNNLFETSYSTNQLNQELLHVQSNIQDKAFSFSNHSSRIIQFQKKMCTNNLIDENSMPDFTPVMSYHDQDNTLVFGHKKGVVSVWTKNREQSL